MQLPEIIPGDVNVRQLAETSVDAIHHRLPAGDLLDDLARGLDAGVRFRADLNWLLADRDRGNLSERERLPG